MDRSSFVRKLETLSGGPEYIGHPDSPHGPDNGWVWREASGQVVKIFATGAVCWFGNKPLGEWETAHGIHFEDGERGLILFLVAKKTGFGGSMPNAQHHQARIEAALAEVLADCTKD